MGKKIAFLHANEILARRKRKIPGHEEEVEPLRLHYREMFTKKTGSAEEGESTSEEETRDEASNEEL